MSFVNELNKVQQESVKSAEGPLMIVAGAGSGKTRVLTYRVAYLISIGVSAYQILALTFTNKAAEEMKKRINHLVGEKCAKLWMGTFHSMFARLLRQEAESIGYDRNFTIYDTDDSQNLIKNIQHNLNIPTQTIKPTAVRSRISGAKNKLIIPSEFSSLAKDFFEEKVAIIYAEYQKILKKNNAMDFDDLLLNPIELFERHPKILNKYQDRFRFILVDEYQDTNRAQYKLLKMLAQKYRNICVVGDDAQSIYGFRGAEIKNILDFEKDFPECKIFRLEQNYRSTKSILTAANQVIKNNLNRIDKNLWTNNPSGDQITVLTAEDEKDEGNRVATQIKVAVASKKLDFKNFTVLYRTNAQSRSIEDSLRKNSIPYVIVGGVEFYKRKEIKDVLAYLRLLVNPKDDVSFRRVVNYPVRGIGNTSMEYLEKFSQKMKCSLFEAASMCDQIPGLSKRAVENIKAFRKLLTKYIKLKAELSAGELSRALVDELGILREFKEEGTIDSLSRWENVYELLSGITEYAAEMENGSLEAFLQEVALVADIDRWDDSHNAVTLMTLHSAKGLEFNTVFITGLEEGLFPIFSSFLVQNELEEERRLFYVGMTRAKEKLYLCYAIRRYRFGEATYPTPSRFLKEINEELLEYDGDRGIPRYYESTTGTMMQSRPVSVKRNIQKRTAEKYLEQISHDYENESQVIPELRVGTHVTHEIFGRGRIVNLSGKGQDLKAVIDFEFVGRKNIMVKYASLRII
ncbi:MAG: 3'-5' exonuclease [Bacteroidota bacterium]|nr:3'-5' exonuclease [Bacteroidota bacterium]